MKYLIINIAVLCIIGLSSANPITESGDGEYGDKFQGDILLTPLQKKLMKSSRSGRTGILNIGARWPKVNNRVIVPYLIDPIFSAAENAIIIRAMKDIQNKTCVTFVRKTTESNYISIISGEGCYSYLGRTGGRQVLSLQKDGCMVHGIVMHELIHALGYMHMHQHPDRDQKVTILWENIQAGLEDQFEKLNPLQFGNFNTPYDIASVMHYRANTFSKNGLKTIKAKHPIDAAVMGQRSYLTTGDVARIKNMYQCT